MLDLNPLLYGSEPCYVVAERNGERDTYLADGAREASGGALLLHTTRGPNWVALWPRQIIAVAPAPRWEFDLFRDRDKKGYALPACPSLDPYAELVPGSLWWLRHLEFPGLMLLKVLQQGVCAIEVAYYASWLGGLQTFTYTAEDHECYNWEPASIRDWRRCALKGSI